MFAQWCQRDGSFDNKHALKVKNQPIWLLSRTPDYFGSDLGVDYGEVIMLGQKKHFTGDHFGTGSVCYAIKIVL